MTRKYNYPEYDKRYAREYNRLWPEKGVLNNAKTRCFSKSNAKYKYYGGKFAALGVEAMSDRYRWGENGLPGYKCLIEDIGRANGRQLNRIDNDLGYVIGNLEWVCPKVNGRNRSNTRSIIIAEEKMTFGEVMDRAVIEVRGVIYPLRKTMRDALGCDVAIHRLGSRKDSI